MTEEEGVPEVGTVTQQENPLRETFVKSNKYLREQMHEMVVYFLTGVRQCFLCMGLLMPGFRLVTL